MSLNYRCDENADGATKLRGASAGISTFNLFEKVAILPSTTRGRANHTELAPHSSTVIFPSRQTCMFIHSGNFFPPLHTQLFKAHLFLCSSFTHVYVSH